MQVNQEKHCWRLKFIDLEIERRRYISIKAEKRKCKLCKNAVENELHFLLKFPILKDTRSQHLSYLNSKFKNFSKISDEMRFVWIHSFEDFFVTLNLS